VENYPSLSGQRGITPAFGYDAPHPSVRGTLTLLNNVLLSTHYGAIRLLSGVHVRRAASAFPDRSPEGDTVEVSRFSCRQLLSVPGVYDYAGPLAGSR